MATEKESEVMVTIHQIIKMVRQKRNQGRYMEVNDLFESVNPRLDQRALSPRVRGMYTLEMARHNFILGHYPLSLNLYEGALNIYNTTQCLTALELHTVEQEAEHARKALLFHKQERCYPQYREFRESIDLYYKTFGDFHLPLFRLVCNIFEEFGVELKQKDVIQTENNVYGMVFRSDVMALDLFYEKEGDVTKRTHIRLRQLVMTPLLQGKGRGKFILNSLFAYTQQEDEGLLLVGDTPSTWVQYVADRCGEIKQRFSDGSVVVEVQRPFDEGTTHTQATAPRLQSFFPAHNQHHQQHPNQNQEQTKAETQTEESSLLRVWSIQKRGVIDHVLQTGSYTPLLTESDWLQSHREQEGLYKLLLEQFNQHNHTQITGLVFGYMWYDKNQIRPFRSVEEFIQVCSRCKGAIQEVWETLEKQEDEMVIVELAYPEHSVYPLFLDVNDVRFLQPPVTFETPYTTEYLEEVLVHLERGVPRPSVIPSGLMQVHLPSIERGSIKMLYPMSALL